MDSKQQQLLKSFRPSKIFIPVAIGLGVVAYMFYNEFDPSVFSSVKFTISSLFWLFVAFLMMIGRDFGYVLRLRILTDGELSWLQCLKVIILWEFTSAVTPSAIGGTSVAIYYVHKENLSVGKSSAIVMATSFLDEMYFIIMFPLLLILLQGTSLFAIDGEDPANAFSFTNEFFTVAVIGYAIKLVFTVLVAYALFVNPRAIKYLMLTVFKLKILQRWRIKVLKIGDDLILASAEIKGKSVMFWMKAFFATFFSWSSRYWVVNCLFLAFFAVNEHFMIFARQLVMWIMMLVTPTPGGAGFAEAFFKGYLSEFIPMVELTVVLALLWRIISYYPYLVIGAFVFPRWIKKTVLHK